MHPIHERILEINREQSNRYIADEGARRRYWAQHPTFFGCVKCMDGRVLFPVLTQTPLGLVKPFRAIGGKFAVWWPSFLGRVRKWVDTAMGMGSQSCLFLTYHTSASDPRLGCAGWEHNTAAARAHAEELARDLAFVFGEQLTAIVAGVETDRDVFTLHGPGGDVSGAMLAGKNADEAHAMVLAAFSKIAPIILEDLLPFLLGNASHVATLTEHPRDRAERGHQERIIALGQGFNWLAEANLALIINDADPNLAESLRVAAGLMVKNLANAAEGDDATLLTCIPYREPGIDQRQATARSRGLLAFASRVVAAAQPELVAGGRLHTMAVIGWEPSKQIEVLDAA